MRLACQSCGHMFTYECATIKKCRVCRGLATEHEQSPISQNRTIIPTKKKEKEYKTKVCLHCGREFLTTRNNKKICSVECATERNREQLKKGRERRYAEGYRPPKRKLTCIICHKKFEHERPKLTCSNACTRKHKTNLMLDYERKGKMYNEKRRKF